jgi:hypothetical protein
MKRVARIVALLPLVLLILARPAHAQQREAAPLEDFIAQVGRLWARGDAAALVRLAPADGRIVLDIGGESGGAVQARHASAALRALFAERESVALRPSRITVAGGEPLRGFGELAWVSRSRGITDPRPATLYIGAVWEDGGWRLSELRLLP